MAERSFRQTSSGLLPDYDPALASTLSTIDLEAPLPTLWPFFEALAHAPLLAIRGGNSDILSAATLEEMARRHPGCETITAEGEGHVPDVGAPLLATRIAAFIEKLDTPPLQISSRGQAGSRRHDNGRTFLVTADKESARQFPLGRPAKKKPRHEAGALIR